VSVPIVLVHGGGHGAWCWEPTVALLAAPVLAVDFPPVSVRGGPGRNDQDPGLETLTLADWADSVLDAATAAGWDRFVLAGHSLGGATIAEVTRRAPDRVAHVVYVSAVVPEEGGTVLGMLPPEIFERAANGLTDDLVRGMFCTDMDEDQTRFVLDHIGTEVLGVMTDPVTRIGTASAMPTTRAFRASPMPVGMATST